ncbi:DUF4259 domain-containing protein [Streptomyces sp. NPDC050161]|uniref:DUF4259 domain-containing protein n=1 Tax=Streptomyces sp. NPDC050161 TaxID=3365604 RepID=UPI0037B5EF35
MGTWGTDPFGGDAAADFAAGLAGLPESRRLFAVRAALAEAAEERRYLEAPEGEVAVAAAALLAAARPGAAPCAPALGPGQAIPEPSEELAGLAVHALDRVLAPDSELAELWDESDAGQEWRASVAGLRTALGPAAERV